MFVDIYLVRRRFFRWLENYDAVSIPLHIGKCVKAARARIVCVVFVDLNKKIMGNVRTTQERNERRDATPHHGSNDNK